MAALGNQTVFETFRDVSPSRHAAGWDHLWDASVTPWDRGRPSEALRDLLAERPDLVPPISDGNKKTALVPGCGRGHDVLLLSSFGYDVVGLDLSAAAIKAARENEKKGLGEGEEDGGQRKRGATGSVRWVVGDFFEDGWREASTAGFDLVFDYTFSCALPMSMRPKWAARMAELLAPDGEARLVILQFPNGKPLTMTGPPWGVNSGMYLALLSRPGEEIQHDEEGNVSGVEEITGSEKGLRRLASFTPRRTHRQGVGEDGKVMDVVSVWGH